MMEYEDVPEDQDVILSGAAATQYFGSMFRLPTEMELDELAQFFAEDDVDGIMRITNEWKDPAERLVAIAVEKKEILAELYASTFVIDMPKIQMQIFHMYDSQVMEGNHTGQLSFIDGFSRVYKRNGSLYTIDPGEELQLDI